MSPLHELALWLAADAYVARHVNWLYFIGVLAITFTVLGYSLYTRNRNALRVFLYGAVVWPLIELAGLLSGWRVYLGAPVVLIWILVGVFEDAGWVTLAYILAEKTHRKFWKR